MSEIYDVIILGAGPAGLAAGSQSQMTSKIILDRS